ncbi:pyroglutamyl-peptidase I family protein [Blastopirellula marina]|uniref:Pyrrolidone-carboxylate peptidase n=1 Tax=Blastopirellula marina DSM 3645 TaxID=314230 RepID=A3ZL11_9BACT|nr:pyrrolidone-carboxylate peptidase [Blastopirellula marina]EAQ82444.1 pyrrolidone-carboxylate peptidase [Blastopirellula marina DSM 3645]
MKRILVTGFEPFGELPDNCTELALRELPLANLAPDFLVEQLILPVDYTAAQAQLGDLYRDKSYAATLHFGQSGAARAAAFEMFAINWKQTGAADPGPLAAAGPQAYRTNLDHQSWLTAMQSVDIDSEVSFHAGAYLCNAVYFWSLQHSAETGSGGPDQALFVHVPLANEQGSSASGNWPITRIQTMMASTFLWLADQVANPDTRPLRERGETPGDASTD